MSVRRLIYGVLVLVTALWALGVLILLASMIGLVGAGNALHSPEFWIVGLSLVPALILHEAGRMRFRGERFRTSNL